MEANGNPSQAGEREDGVVQIQRCLAWEGKEDLRNPTWRSVSKVKRGEREVHQPTNRPDLFKHGRCQPQQFSWIANVEQSFHPVRLAQLQLTEEPCQMPSSDLTKSKFA